jgi:hypothetical protein
MSDAVAHLRRARWKNSLATLWKQSLQTHVREPNKVHWRCFQDVSAEYQLRGVDPPYWTAERELSWLRKKAADSADNLEVQQRVLGVMEKLVRGPDIKSTS